MFEGREYLGLWEHRGTDFAPIFFFLSAAYRFYIIRRVADSIGKLLHW